ncbi:hypothetical protein I6N95_01785 [Vagococcus sp. BWB3-3]|uniref:SD-repeat containing protein B domain-containing protein n=1 Tax=Vagococcus allomyrinae TaxID=2794353 RepID=A0A940P7Y4_9ENTE|nr:SdrD B-like domain-containing protein [Vagococcus allomyrinae]MBP1039730.1 hypothetical protein [Vagococcus allomyrinae]
MKKKIVKLFVAFCLIGPIFLGAAPAAEAAVFSPSIYTIAGSVFADTNSNGIYEPKNLDAPLKEKMVELYAGLEDALSETNSISRVKTSVLGTYRFTKLKPGTYYLKYGSETRYHPVAQTGNPQDENGEPIAGIVEVVVTRASLVTTKLLALNKTANLSFYAYEDANWNRQMDPTEKLATDKSVMLVDVVKTLKALESGELYKNERKAMYNSVLFTNTVNISNGAIRIGTMDAKGVKNIFSDLEPSLYLAMRAPFNATLSGAASNMGQVNTFLDIFSGVTDITPILENPSLLTPSDGSITTDPNNLYINQLVSMLPKILDEADKIDFNKLLGKDAAGNVSSLLGAGRTVHQLVNSVPDMRIMSVNVWGNTYDLTNLKVQKTNDMYFGYKNAVQLTGTAFNDLNSNGIKDDTSEAVKQVNLTIYDQDGQIISALTTPKFGKYKFDKLPYDTTMYLVVEDGETLTKPFEGEVPAALEGKAIIGGYYMTGTEADWQINQDIAVAPVSDSLPALTSDSE